MAQYPHAGLSQNGPQPTMHSYPDTDHYPPRMNEIRYAGGRTPSPTPSEIEATAKLFDVKKYLHWKFWARKAWIPWYIIGALLLAGAIALSRYDKQIVHWLTPAGQWMRKLPFGWLIPIAILFVISFPPLFGHEIVAILAGVIWGLGVGFAIVAAGTFLGELGNFYAFKYCCRARGEKLEKTNIMYSCLARVVREGGFRIALVIRLSVLPGHFSTAVFSTCGMHVLIFALAAFFSLPKQFLYVYVGVIFEETGAGTQSNKDKLISDVVLVVTILITIVACWWVWREINRVKPSVIYDRRKARQVKMASAAYDMDNSSTTALNPRAFTSETELPLNVPPQRPVQFPLRNGPGAYAGYGGYNPSYAQGPYGETLDEDDRKSTEIVGWETRGAHIADIRGMPLPKQGRASDDDRASEDSVATVRRQDPTLPPPLPPPGLGQESPYQQRQQQPRQPNLGAQVPPAEISLPSPYERGPGQPASRYELSVPPVASQADMSLPSPYERGPGQPASRYEPSAPPVAAQAPPADISLPSPYERGPAPPASRYQVSDPPVASHTLMASDSTYEARQAQHRYELSDPPVMMHTPLPSDTTYGYHPPQAPSDDVGLYAHSVQPSDVTYDSQYPLTTAFHGRDATDASQDSFAGAHGREGTEDSQYPLTGGHRQEATDAAVENVAGRHGAEPTDASYYTAAGSPTGSPLQPPTLPPVRTPSPLTMSNIAR